jgi:poly(3-hydroxybutyrate) depolymerase
MQLNNQLSRLALCLAVLALLWPGVALGDHDDLPDPAPQVSDAALPGDLNLDPHGVTVSGLSSGGFFAHQFHIAYSELVTGAGIVAGGPYGCVETIANPYWPLARLDRLSAALVGCSRFWGDRFWGLRPAPPDAARSVALIRQASRRGAIDDPENLSTDRVWLFHGEVDEMVPEVIVEALEGVYRQLGVEEPDLEVHRHRAGHGMPISEGPADGGLAPLACEEQGPPFIIECGFDAAELMLRHLYPDGFAEAPADAHDAGTLLAFDQTRFFDSQDATAGLRGVGYLYVPQACRTDQAEICRLHVAFHGCRQSVEAVHDAFVRHAGYNGWAAAARIVVLYPQVVPSRANPYGCWDFWGYSGDDYRVKDGRQMAVVKAMIDHMLGSR